MDSSVKPSTIGRRIFKLVSIFALLGVLCIAGLFAALLLEHTLPVTLPEPTGPYAVGRAMYEWRDEATLDTLAPKANTKRELLVWIWYPAAPRPSPATQSYLPSSVCNEVQKDLGFVIGKLLTRDLSKVRSHGVWNADVSLKENSYPVLMLRAGASAEVWNYSTLAEDLASHGYVVAGFDAPYRSHVVVFPDGRVLRRLPANNPELCLELSGTERDRCAERLLSVWTSDMGFVLDRLTQLNTADASGKFTGRLNLSKVGVLGHSFGGAATLKFCHEDERCKAGVDLDGAPLGPVIQTGVNRPFMILLSDHRGESNAEGGEIKSNLESIYNRLPPSARAFLYIRGANHFQFSDDSALLKSHIVMGVLRTIGGMLKGRRQLAITAFCLREFFDDFLKGSAVPFDATKSEYPEVQDVVE